MTAGWDFTVHMGEVPAALARERGTLGKKIAREAMKDATEFMVGRLAMNTPAGATGKARQAIVPSVEDESGEIVGHIDYAEPASGYIQYPDQGTHHTKWPPYQPIALWAARVLGTSDKKRINAIRRAIYRHGVKPQKFVEKTADASEGEVAQVFAQGVESAVKRIGGGTR